MRQNPWIRMNTTKLVNLKQFLTECEFKPEYDNFPLREIQKLFNGFELEIIKLERENQDLKNILDEKNKQIQDLSKES